SLGPRLRGDDVMMSPNALALNAFIDSLEKGGKTIGSVNTVRHNPHRCTALLDCVECWEARCYLLYRCVQMVVSSIKAIMHRVKYALCLRRCFGGNGAFD
ncbi:MAG: hypothetical protein JXX14_06125, partial [Deltaproteobacteria bacterium]|nr:hypothetical protein [Deltaproteobacteria bacterium]